MFDLIRVQTKVSCKKFIASRDCFDRSLTRVETRRVTEAVLKKLTSEKLSESEDEYVESED